MGTEIFWSASTSTNVSPQTAEVFAAGSRGFIFRVTVLEGRVIKVYSVFQNEDEVLLKPNTKFVSRPCYSETKVELMGFHVVEMVEVAVKFIS